MSLGDNGSAANGVAANLARLPPPRPRWQAGGAVGSLAATGLLYEFPDDTDILATATIAGSRASGQPRPWSC